MGPLDVGAFSGGEWDCFGKMWANEDRYCSPQPLGQDDENVGMQSMFCSTLDAGGNKSMFYFFDSHNSNLQYISQESSHNSNCSDHSVFKVNPEAHTNYQFVYIIDHVLANSTSMGFCVMDDQKNPGSGVQSDIEMKENVNLSEDEGSDKSKSLYHSQVEPIPAKHLKLKRKLDVPELKVRIEDKINSHGNCNKKPPRVSKEVQHCMKNQKLEKNGNQAEGINAGSDHGSSYSSYTQEDDNASQANSGGPTYALNLKGKTNASRRSATDPQSLYARKRRERINERVRILQNLVPNGTKVDISTMLEEAVH